MSLVTQLANLATRISNEFNTLRSEISSALSGKANTTHGHAISDVTNLQTELNGKAPIASPTFTGTATSPAARLTNTTLPTASSTAHAFQVGASTTTNLRLGPTRIQAANNNSTAELSIQGAGGQATFGGIATTSVAQAIATKQFRNVTVSTADPSGGLDGEVWLKYS
jgi:hypothetical protein